MQVSRKYQINSTNISDELVPTLISEIEILKKCRNINIVSYYGFWGPDSNNYLWLLMDCCEVGSVYDMLEMDTHLTEERVAYIMKSVLLALVYLHATGIMHRDIKASNILLTNDAEVKTL
eukprot:TRINITY_DN1323_c0_g1_i1.p1 TRINITY_DN1323_c0_g1~~TRINITY_DN1323_c0_g1_i1.p1  ORF type:complete len:120 (+),score=3.24 TRINITY_DN1323_c0_g1_i1:100-459(+)